MNTKQSTHSLTLSIVIPVYNSELIVAETVNLINAELSQIEISHEIILVNDGSTDSSWSVLVELKKQFPQLVIINFLKNYGQHSAVFCGIQNSRGNYVVTMDDDLQNPPSEIKKLYNKILEGYDLVFAVFDKKQHEDYRKLGTKVIDYLNTKIFGKPKSLKLTNFRIFSKEVAQRVSKYKTYHPYIPGLLLMHASTMANALTEHHPRKIGKSNYSLTRILKLVFRILFNYSTYPLNIALIFGSLVSLFSFCLSIFFVLKAIFIGTNVQGWTTVVVLISLFNGFLLIIFGIIGQYIVRMMNQIAQPMPFIVKDLK